MGSSSESSESRSPLSNRDFTIPRGDGNENVKNNNRCTVGKTTTLYVHRTFYTFLCRFCTTTTWNCLISLFKENVKKRRWNFILFLNLNMFLENSTPAAFAYIWQSIWAGIIAIRPKERKFIFEATFLLASCPPIVKSLLTELRTVLSGKPEMTIDVSSLPRRHNTHLLTLQVNCDKGETQRRRDYSLIFCLFARKLGTSVDQSKHAIYNSAISKQKQKIALRQGWQWAFKQTTFE